MRNQFPILNFQTIKQIHPLCFSSSKKFTSSLFQIASPFFAIGEKGPFSNCKHGIALLHSSIQLAKTNNLETKKLSFQQYNYEI